MTARASEPAEKHPEAPLPNADASEERKYFSYEGSRVPFFVIVIWVAFFVWGVAYLIRWIPESWREWFAR